MRRLVLVALLLGLAPRARAQASWKYPPTRTVEASDTYFGKTYRDPLRWLEAVESQEVQGWFKAQADVAEEVLARIPARDALTKEWLELDRREPATYRNISYENGRVFYQKTLGGENVGKLHLREGWRGAEQLLFDPATYRAGVVTTIESAVPSWDGRHVVLGLSSGGVEYTELRVLDVAKRVLLPERIHPSLGATGWQPDGRAFFYDAGKTENLKSPDLELHRKTRVHRLGTPVASDRDLLSDEAAPELGLSPKEIPSASIDEASPGWLLARLWTARSELHMLFAPASRLKDEKVKWDVLCRPSDRLVRGLVIHGEHAYAVTYADAPRYRLVRTSVRRPDWPHAETVLPEAPDTIDAIARSKDYLLVSYTNGVTGRLVRVDLASGRATPVVLPGGGAVEVLCPDARSNRCVVTLTSWITPARRHDLDAAKGTLARSIFDSGVVSSGFDALLVEEVEVPGHDGTLVPLSIVRRRDLRLDGRNSVILFGYGAFGFSAKPAFTPTVSVALRGVVVAYAHPRGGGEKGEAWYRAGFKTTKPNTWKDFISCAEWLVKQGYTSPERLAGHGTSAGGILLSRAITDRPDLFGAAVCNVGLANALRMEFTPSGSFFTPEFGTVQDPVEALALHEMDGVQHVRPGVNYPAVLGVGGWNDALVPVWQQGKFVAALQAASTSGRPVLMQVNYESGHLTQEKLLSFRDSANQFAFLLWQTGHPDFQPAPPAK